MLNCLHKLTLSSKLRIAIEEQARTGTDIDVLHWMGRAALEFIGQAGMGSSFDPLTPGSDATNVVGKALKEFLCVYVLTPCPSLSLNMLPYYLAR